MRVGAARVLMNLAIAASRAAVTVMLSIGGFGRLGLSAGQQCQQQEEGGGQARKQTRHGGTPVYYIDSI